MASGWRPPHSAPSLPLHSPSSSPSDSLRTPDTSSLFLSSLGTSHTSQAAVDFTSLEDLLNFTGISHQPPSSVSLSSPSLETLAQGMKQKQVSAPIGPPEAKRLCPDITTSTSHSSPLTNSASHSSLLTNSTPHSSLLTTLSSPLPPTIHVSPLPPSTMVVSSSSSSFSSSWSPRTASTVIPSLFPTSSSMSSMAIPPVTTSVPPFTHQHVPSVIPLSTTQPLPVTTRLPLATTTAVSRTAALPTNIIPSSLHSLSSGTLPPLCNSPLSTRDLSVSSGGVTRRSQSPVSVPSPVVPSVLAHASDANPLLQPVYSRAASATLQALSLSPSSSNSSSALPGSFLSSSTAQCPATSTLPASQQGTIFPLRTASPTAPSTPTQPLQLSTSALPLNVTAGASAPSLPLLPTNPAQRALLVQLVQAYRQCTALGDTQGQARVKAQLNMLLQAQQKLSGAKSSTTAPQNTHSHPLPPSPASHPSPTPSSSTPVTPMTLIKTNNFMQPKPPPPLPTFHTSLQTLPLTSSLLTSSHTSIVTTSHTPLLTSSHMSLLTTSQTTPLTPSLLTSKGIDLATTKAVAMAPNTLVSTSVAIGTGLPVSMSTAASSVSTSSPDHTITTLTPITSTHSRALPSSGPANALKAAALYNLRLRQLQLFLQSLPEEKRPHSIPELKALLQLSGGQLNALAKPAPATSSLPPSTESSYTGAGAMPAALSLLPTTTAMVAGQSAPTVGQCLPLLTRGLPTTPTHASLNAASPPSPQPASQPLSTPASAAVPNVALAGGSSMPLSTSSLALICGGSRALSASGPVHATSSAALPGSTPDTTQLPPATSETTVLPPVTTLQTTTVPSSITNTAHFLKQPTPTTEPIKPGVPTPLPPGVNPETLAVLCRMPDSDLQKLNLPTALLTAIRVWRGQHSSVSQRGRKNAGLPVIIPPSQSSPSLLPSLSSASAIQPPNLANSHSMQATPPSDSFSSLTTVGLRAQSHLKGPSPALTQSSLPAASLPARTYPPSRPLTRHQLRTEQTKAERDRVDALNKVLQSSEEARIAYRFNMLRDKMTNQLMAPDSHTPFKSLHDVIARLLPYHMWSEAEPPPGAIEKADAVYESVAHVLMSRSQGLMSNYQHLIYHDAQRDSEAVMRVYLERFFIESEKERREQELQESQQAAQIAANLSLIAAGALGEECGDTALGFDADFALGDVMNTDPILTFEPGIT